VQDYAHDAHAVSKHFGAVFENSDVFKDILDRLEKLSPIVMYTHALSGMVIR
jgi:hypothetical protein